MSVKKRKKSSYISGCLRLRIIHAFSRILSNALIKHSPHSLDDTNTIDASLALVRYRGFRRSSQFLSLPTVAVIFTTLFLSHPLNSRGKLRYNAILSISPITIYFTPTWIYRNVSPKIVSRTFHRVPREQRHFPGTRYQCSRLLFVRRVSYRGNSPRKRASPGPQFAIEQLSPKERRLIGARRRGFRLVCVVLGKSSERSLCYSSPRRNLPARG